jgi:type IV pilus assembly protein PilY1
MNMKKALTWVLILSLICGNYLPVARADDSDIFGTNIAPNVMLLLDSSQSMTDEVGTLVAYASGTTYTAIAYRGDTIVGTTVYKKLTSGSSGGLSCSTSNPCYAVYAASIAAVNSSSARTALSSVGYWSGSIGGSNLNLYYGNYLDYYFCSSCDGVEPKIDIARRVLENLVTITEGVRFGLMKFKSNGGEVVQPIRDMTAANISLLVNGVAGQNNGIKNTALTSVGTVLGEQVRDAGNYYKGTYTGQSSPIEYSCQPNFIIVISDGLWTGSVNPKTEATNRFTQDHSTTFTGLQNVLVHTIGFGLNSSNSDDATAIADLKTMAVNGGGSYFTASNSAQLEVVLQDAISQILAANFSFATPTIPSTGASGATRAYLASFQSNSSRPFWKGYLKAYSLVNGTVPTDSVTHLPSGTVIWDAGQQLSLKTASSRKIRTYASGALQDFVTTNTAAITTALLGAADSTEKDQIINYIRGAVDYNDEDIPPDGNTTEERPWKLGDIFHSTPVFVPPPFFLSTDSSYNTFKTDTTNANRTTVLLAGANDGMLHAFRESDGDEQWAFIPPNLLDQLKNLKALSGTRDYYVDASPVVDDVKTGGAWKTIAVFGERRGGNNYYALNITATGTAPVYLWSFSDSRLGETWSEPAIGKVKMSDNTDKWVAFFGGGFDTSHSNYNSGNKTTESFFAIDLATGAKLWEYYNTGAGDSQYMNFSIPATPTAVDVNNDGYIDRVYIGDVGGQLWKFDVSAPATLSGGLVTNWTGKRLFVADSSQANPPAAGEFYPTQAIYSSPTLAFDANNNLWIYFGTGDRYHPNNSSTNRFYGIKDDTGMTTGSALTESSLTNMSGGTGTVSQGWYLIFSPANSGEKVLAPATVFNGAVEFTTFTPVSTVTCSTGSGNAKMYSANMTAGDAALNLVNGTLLSSGQSVLTNGMSIGTGIPSKVVIVNGQGWVTGTTSKEIYQGDFQKPAMKKLVGWREVF